MITKKDISKLDSLLYLYAISQTGSKREVAEQLGTSVDTINKYMAEFEAELKTKFLSCNGRGTVITPEGKQILTISEDVVRAIRSLGDYADRATAYKGIVRLAMPDAIADHFGPKELCKFVKKYPDISFENQVSNKMPDIGVMEADICMDYEVIQHPDTVLIASKEVKGGLFASQKYLDTYGHPLNIDDLVENHRLCSKTTYENYVPDWAEIVSNAKHMVYKTNSIFSMRDILEAGIAIGISPYGYGRANLVHLKNLNFNYSVRIYLMAHKDTKDMPRIRVVLDFLKEMMAKRITNY